MSKSQYISEEKKFPKINTFIYPYFLYDSVVFVLCGGGGVREAKMQHNLHWTYVPGRKWDIAYCFGKSCVLLF